MINCALMFMNSNHYGRRCHSILLQLVPCNDMFKVISDIMAEWNDIINTFFITINCCNAKKMSCASMFIIIHHYGRKCLNFLLQLEPCNVMFKVISHLMGQWHEMINTILSTINFCENELGIYVYDQQSLWNRMS